MTSSTIPTNSADVLRLLDAARMGDFGTIRAFLDQGIPVDAPDAQGMTALMTAAFHGLPETVDLLLSRGAQAEIEDKYGATALHWALEMNDLEPDLKCVKLLVGAGISLEARNNTGQTALLKCAQSAVDYYDHYGGVVDVAPFLLLLMKLGADLSAVDDNGHSARDIMDKKPQAFIPEAVAPVYALMNAALMQRGTRMVAGEGRVRRI